MALYNKDGTSGQIAARENFTDIGHDLKGILNRLLKNDRLIKLLYYSQSDIENLPNLTKAEKVSMINDHIKIIPRLPKDIESKNYLVIQMDSFTPIGNNSRMRGFLLSFDVLCHADNWIMDDYMLRPFKILQELDSMFNMSKLHSLGPVNFVSANQILINEELMGYSIYFKVHDFE